MKKRVSENRKQKIKTRYLLRLKFSTCLHVVGKGKRRKGNSGAEALPQGSGADLD